ncbi:M23 family metallopeptidase [Marinirhabdus gelatinilytica]|uniref:Peptidase M23-like protein n=1 Tax=Marinirhabdus gelatinilytica TaxID=1703343 RepID=A0A370QK61_9FLAO|nr:M23 family metallopeptidase [Marinirhabdus gelatinilytica]RDK88763.1 peptidase M23-like protein [Marinirhabdus gelatinilytica]
MKKPNLFSFFILVLLLAGCEQVQKVTDVVVQPTAREVYDRNFEKDDSLLLKWKKAFGRALQDSIIVTLPYAESGIYSAENFNVYSYDVQLQEGEKLIVSVEKQPDSAQVFIEVFQKPEDTTKTLKLLKASERDSSQLTHTVKKYGVYKITVQPEMGLAFPFQLKMYTQPTYTFPVSGAGNKNIQSFWGAPRGGGKRSHEGVDIFAPKGTPLIAITDGRISSTGNRGLGGKQVWLRDGLFGKTIYYAHLDSIAVKTGQRVQLGDTLGFVGNTGNAKTTEPHLHFGIYKGSTGPVNPYPFIKQTEIPEISPINKATSGSVKRNKTTIHQGPSSALDEIGQTNKNDTISIMGKYGRWFHIVTKDSLKGFVRDNQIDPFLSN